MHICVSKLTIIGSDNGLSPGRRQAIIWTNAGILLNGPLETNVGEILSEIHTFSFKKVHLKMSSGKCRPFCLGLNVLMKGATGFNLTTLYKMKSISIYHFWLGAGILDHHCIKHEHQHLNVDSTNPASASLIPLTSWDLIVIRLMWWYTIWSTWHPMHGINILVMTVTSCMSCCLKLQVFDYLFKSLLRIIRKEIYELHFAVPLWGESMCDCWILHIKGHQ